MKNATAHVKSFEALLRKLKQSFEPQPLEQREAATQLVIGFLQWEATRKSADAAHARLMAVLVDNNDLRVSHAPEIVQLIGPRYPRAQERAARLHDSLQEIFVREHQVSLDFLTEKSKKDARAYLESLPGMTGYVCSYVLLTALGAPVVPVDDNLAAHLMQQNVVEPDSSADEIAAFIEKAIKPSEAMQTHLLLQEWSDSLPPTVIETPRVSVPAPVKVKATEPAVEAFKETKKTTKKTTKATTKKTTKATTKKTTKATTKKTTKAAAAVEVAPAAVTKKTTRKSTKAVKKAAEPAAKKATTKKTTKKSTKKSTSKAR